MKHFRSSLLECGLEFHYINVDVARSLECMGDVLMTPRCPWSFFCRGSPASTCQQRVLQSFQKAHWFIDTAALAKTLFQRSVGVPMAMDSFGENAPSIPIQLGQQSKSVRTHLYVIMHAQSNLQLRPVQPLIADWDTLLQHLVQMPKCWKVHKGGGRGLFDKEPCASACAE